jgi:hypothetical protein
MPRKIFIYSLRIFTSLVLVLSFLLVVAVRLSDKGDIVDRNSGWILLAFLIALGVFIYSLFISDGSPKHIYRKKTTDELMNEIRKSNLDRLKTGKSKRYKN